MEDQLLFENLDEKLEDENGFVTANWLSITFDLNINDSRRLMASYIQARDNLSSVYLLTGISSQGDILVKLVNSEQLSLAEKSFSSPPKRVVYSIQRQKCKDSLSLACCNLLHDISENQLKRIISIPWEPSTKSSRTPFSCRENQEITQEITPKAVAKSDVPTIPKLATTGHDEKIKTSDLKNFFTKAEKPVQQVNIPQKDVKPNNKIEVISKPVKVEKPKGLVVIEEDDEEFGPKNTLSAQKRKRVVIESDDEEENVENENRKYAGSVNSKANSQRDDKSTKKKQNPSNKDKGKVLVSDSETDSFIVESVKPEKSPKKMKKTDVEKTPSHLVNKPEVNLKSSPKPPEAARPNRIRHQVMKTFADEDGFMVTEKGWESASDDETSKPAAMTNVDSDKSQKSQPSLQLKTDNSASLTASPIIKPDKPIKQANKKNTNIKPAVKQASLSSFFKSNNT
ncbi:unnamed protein product [Trichobilharzia szidati]|nr:unnamed protein product [Trichobilharzia szidati]